MLNAIDRILRAMADVAHSEAAWTQEAMWASAFFSLIGYGRQEEQE